jgi:hypothetical protein
LRRDIDSHLRRERGEELDVDAVIEATSELLRIEGKHEVALAWARALEPRTEEQALRQVQIVLQCTLAAGDAAFAREAIIEECDRLQGFVDEARLATNAVRWHAMIDYHVAARHYDSALYQRAARALEDRAPSAVNAPARWDMQLRAANAWLEAGELNRASSLAELVRRDAGGDGYFAVSAWATLRTCQYRAGDVDDAAFELVDAARAVGNVGEYVRATITEVAVAYRGRQHAVAAELARQAIRATAAIADDASPLGWARLLLEAAEIRCAGGSQDPNACATGLPPLFVVRLARCELPGIGLQAAALAGVVRGVPWTEWLSAMSAAEPTDRREILSVEECRVLLLGASEPEHASH